MGLAEFALSPVSNLSCFLRVEWGEGWAGEGQRRLRTCLGKGPGDSEGRMKGCAESSQSLPFPHPGI